MALLLWYIALVETLQRTANSAGEMYLRSKASALFDLRGAFVGLSGIASIDSPNAT
jgi:hypothetical protein